MRDDSIRNSSFKRHWKKLLRASNRDADVAADRHIQYAEEAVMREFTGADKYLKKLAAEFEKPQTSLFSSSLSPESLGCKGDYIERKLAEVAGYQMALGESGRVGLVNTISAAINDIKNAYGLAMTAQFISEGISPKDHCLINMSSALKRVEVRSVAERIVARIMDGAQIITRRELDLEESIGI